MNFYRETLEKTLQEKIAYFNNVGMGKEAELLQARLNSLAEKSAKNKVKTAVVSQKEQIESTVVKNIRDNLRAKLIAETHHIPELEKQYILENLSKAKILKELKPLRIIYMERLLKINRASRGEKSFVFGENTELGSGPYNNEKIFNEALELIYSQDPLWIEDLKELYFSIMPLSSITATSKSLL
jgi:hypothetical protein